MFIHGSMFQMWWLAEQMIAITATLKMRGRVGGGGEGGGWLTSDLKLGGEAKNTFSQQLFKIFNKVGRGAEAPPAPPPPRALCQYHSIIVFTHHDQLLRQSTSAVVTHDPSQTTQELFCF